MTGLLQGLSKKCAWGTAPEIVIWHCIPNVLQERKRFLMEIPMSRYLSAAVAVTLLSAPAFADGHAGSGDAEAGEKAFRQCQACHVVVDDDGNTLAGRSAKTGPNLYGVIGRQAGTYDGFRYSDGVVAAGEAGLTWNEVDFTAFVQDPTAHIRAYTDDGSARSKMSFKLRKAEDAADLYTFLVSVGPELDEAALAAMADAAAASPAAE